jgi:hypothetical protein
MSKNNQIEKSSPEHNLTKRFLRNPTRKSAIHAKCYECISYNDDSDWKQSIRNCKCFDCFLWPYRPYRKEKTQAETLEVFLKRYSKLISGNERSPEHNLMRRFLKSPTRKSAIHARCFMDDGGTIYSFPDPGYRQRIREGELHNPCDSGCPLRGYRPFQK